MSILHMPHAFYNVTPEYLNFVKSFIVIILRYKLDKALRYANGTTIPYSLSNVIDLLMSDYNIHILFQYYFMLFANLQFIQNTASDLTYIVKKADEWLAKELHSYQHADSVTMPALIPTQTSIEEYVDDISNKFVNFHNQSSREYHLQQYILNADSPYVLKQYKIKQQNTVLRNAIVYSVLNYKFELRPIGAPLTSSIPNYNENISAFLEYYSKLPSHLQDIIYDTGNREDFTTLPFKLQYEILAIRMMHNYHSLEPIENWLCENGRTLIL